MTSSSAGRRVVQVALLASFCCGLLAGCQRVPRGLEFTSYQDPYFPQRFRVAFDQCVYHVDGSGDIHIAGRAETAADGAADAITSLLHIHVYWRPRPGATFVNPTGMSATVRYVEHSAAGTAVYGGTGFVYPRTLRDNTLLAQIDSGTLAVDSTTGRPAERIGDARLRGRLRARRDAYQTLDLMRTIKLHVGGAQSER